MSMEFKKFQNKILGHMKTFNEVYIRLLAHFLGREKHLSVFFPNSLYIKINNISKTLYESRNNEIFLEFWHTLMWQLKE